MSFKYPLVLVGRRYGSSADLLRRLLEEIDAHSTKLLLWNNGLEQLHKSLGEAARTERLHSGPCRALQRLEDRWWQLKGGAYATFHMKQEAITGVLDAWPHAEFGDMIDTHNLSLRDDAENPLPALEKFAIAASILEQLPEEEASKRASIGEARGYESLDFIRALYERHSLRPLSLPLPQFTAV
ncbi:hypothetical protein DIPPA_13591 [Diplonema papillatum]|nr:hypothetical protein DIPPA_13591 [Diplonema papillatum]